MYLFNGIPNPLTFLSPYIQEMTESSSETHHMQGYHNPRTAERFSIHSLLTFGRMRKIKLQLWIKIAYTGSTIISMSVFPLSLPCGI